MLSAYLYINKGVDYDLPFIECIKSAVKFCDEVVVGSDPRFQDGTIEEISRLVEEDDKIKLHEIEFDFNKKNVPAHIKNTLRQKCSCDWLLELDADKIVSDGEILRKKVSQLTNNVYIVSSNVIQLFNGNNVKGSEPNRQDVISRNHPGIIHGGKERKGCGYITDKGYPMSAGYHIDNIQILHYGWFCLPRRWEMKQTHHYYEGRSDGTYDNLEDYNQNLDGEPVDFWDLPWQRPMDHYTGAIIAEMKHPSIKKYNSEHPSIMGNWIERQSDKILTVKKSKKISELINKFRGK